MSVPVFVVLLFLFLLHHLVQPTRALLLFSLNRVDNSEHPRRHQARWPCDLVLVDGAEAADGMVFTFELRQIP
jgi:hypothetical protein